MEIDLVDGLDEKGRYALLFSRRTLKVAEYFFSMRPGWLCYRFDELIILEGYQPNRVTRQFGYSQATIYDGRPFIPGIVDTRNTKIVPVETRYYAASIIWLHLLRLRTGSHLQLALPYSHTGVSYTHFTWVRLSFGPFLERGSRKYERQMRLLSIPRGQRPRRNSSRLGDIADKGRDDSTMVKETTSPSRVRLREPSPSHTEVPSSSRRRRKVRQMEPPRASTDWSASPTSRQLLTPDEVPSRPRLSVGVEPIIFEDTEEGVLSTFATELTALETGTPQVDAPPLPGPSSIAYWPEETSYAGELGFSTAPTMTIVPETQTPQMDPFPLLTPFIVAH